MVPGLHVGQLSSDSWAINSRGTNKLYSNKMLVMIDGRTVFNQLFNGTNWSRVSTMLADIEKIEVIRGPGGSLWGSNAAQGIVNIITKETNATTGAQQLDHQVETRYGFQTENMGGRLYATRKRVKASSYPNGDEQSAQDTFPQGDVYEGIEEYTKITLGNPSDDEYRVKGGNILGRYEHQFSDTSSSSLQVYYDYTSHKSSTYQIERDTIDIDFQHSLTLTR